MQTPGLCMLCINNMQSHGLCIFYGFLNHEKTTVIQKLKASFIFWFCAKKTLGSILAHKRSNHFGMNFPIGAIYIQLTICVKTWIFLSLLLILLIK